MSPTFASPYVIQIQKNKGIQQLLTTQETVSLFSVMDSTICPIRKYTIHDVLGKIEGNHPLAVKFGALDYLEQGDL